MKWILGLSVIVSMCLASCLETNKLDAQDKTGWKSDQHQYQLPIGERDGFSSTRTYQRTYYAGFTAPQATGFVSEQVTPTQQINRVVQRSKTVNIASAATCSCGCKKVGCTCGSVIASQNCNSTRTITRSHTFSHSRNAETPYPPNEAYNQTVNPSP